MGAGQVTPDEYCDTIRGIAFDRETTKAAFKSGRAAEAAERDQDLTIACLEGHARGRESLQRELKGQEPGAWWTSNGRLVAVVPDTDKPKSVPLYARPIPAPDVRELVEALKAARRALAHAAYVDPTYDADYEQIDALLTKHRGQS